MDSHRRRDPFIFTALVIAFVTTAATAQQWQQTASSPKGSGITDLVVKQSNGYLFATTGSFDWPNADTGGVHRSTDGGNTWERVFPAFVARVIDVTPDGTIWASVWDFPNEDESLYSSTDDGETWTLRYNGAPNNNIFSFAYDPGNPQILWLGARSFLVVSYNGGSSWSHLTPVNVGWWIVQVVVQQAASMTSSGRVWVIARNPTTFVNHVYWTNAPSQGWNQMTGDTPTDTLVSLAIVHDSTDAFGSEVDGIYAGTSNGRIYKAAPVYRPPFSPPTSMSLNYEAPGSPSIVAFENINFEDVLKEPGVFGPGSRKSYAARDDDDDEGPTSPGGPGGIIKTIDLGQSWEVINDGLPADNLRMSSLASHVTSGVTAIVYAGMFLNQNDGGPVYWHEVVTTDVDQEVEGIPGGFALHQNYPNPFNPMTSIGYEMREEGYVTLKIFDLLGREVATLVNEKQVPGAYEVMWDAGGHVSGVYLYRLRAGDFVETKKLVLLR
jgi:photosystem II stability/assembly factor-like uncharacterized protein